MGTYCIMKGTLLNTLYCPIWKKNLKRVDICKCITDSLCCTPETDTTLYINCTPIEINFKK